MTYELLKRLKDAGFPLQRVAVEAGRETVLKRPAVVFSLSASLAGAGIYYIPSLSDLVEACGNHLRSMFRVQEGWACNRGRDAEQEDTPFETHGPTLDDALAELWLTHSAPAAPEESLEP